MTDTPPDPPDAVSCDVSPYLLKRLRSVDEAMTDLRNRPRRGAQRRCEADSARVGRKVSEEPVGA